MPYTFEPLDSSNNLMTLQSAFRLHKKTVTTSAGILVLIKLNFKEISAYNSSASNTRQRVKECRHGDGGNL